MRIFTLKIRIFTFELHVKRDQTTAQFLAHVMKTADVFYILGIYFVIGLYLFHVSTPKITFVDINR